MQAICRFLHKSLGTPVRRTPLREAAEMWYNTGMFGRSRKGQAMLEYVLSFASLLVVVGILWGLVAVVVRHAERTESLVAADCP